MAGSRGEEAVSPASGHFTARPPQASRKTYPRPLSFEVGTGSLAILRTAGLDAGAVAPAFCGEPGPPHSVVFPEVHSEALCLKPQGPSAQRLYEETDLLEPEVPLCALST